MIDSVDPNDTETLDKIDARIHRYVFTYYDQKGDIIPPREDNIKIFKNSVELYVDGELVYTASGLDLPSFTRSRDALIQAIEWERQNSKTE